MMEKKQTDQLQRDYLEACRYLENIPKFTEKHTVEHTRRCLEALGSPDRKVRCVHVAGTNGKGSICAYLHACFLEVGLKTGLFTSPHLIRINERIRVGTEDIPDGEFVRVFRKVRGAVCALAADGVPHPSYFEFLFLMGETYFAEQHCDIAVLETGLGGRLDATNVVEQPLASVITSVSFDHMQYLGHTIPEIAREKAGIIKPGVPCIYLAKDTEVARVIRKTAAMRQSPAFPVDDASYTITRIGGGSIDFHTAFRYDGNADYTVRGSAPYQAENAALAVRTLCVLKETQPSLFTGLGREEVKRGFAAAVWPGRMEEIRPGVFLDGAHNEDGIRRMTEGIRLLTHGEPSALLFAVVSDKDYTEMIRELVREANPAFVVLTEVAGSRRTDPERLAEVFRKEGTRVFICPDPKEALETALAERGDMLLFICGSLYLIGEIREMLHD